MWNRSSRIEYLLGAAVPYTKQVSTDLVALEGFIFSPIVTSWSWARGFSIAGLHFSIMRSPHAYFVRTRRRLRKGSHIVLTSTLRLLHSCVDVGNLGTTTPYVKHASRVRASRAQGVGFISAKLNLWRRRRGGHIWNWLVLK